MPKERFHLFLADEYLNSGKAPALLTGHLKDEHLSYFLGAVSPDIYFYDLPTFSMNRLGDRLHRFMEREGLSAIKDWLSKSAGAVPKAGFAWGMGFASHFLADEIWHPVINGLAQSLEFCGKKGLSALGCHRVIESELESYWFKRMGAPDGYVGYLRRYAAQKERLGAISSIYRGFLVHAGLEPMPTEARIRRCYLNQNFLLRLFANPLLRGQRDRLLAMRSGRYLGSLIVPDRPVLPYGPLFRVPAERDPFSDEFMDEGLTSLKLRLADFAERLSPFLPG